MEGIDRSDQCDSQIIEFSAVVFSPIPHHFDLQLLYAAVLLGIESSIQLAALVANSLLDDKRTSIVENGTHSFSGV